MKTTSFIATLLVAFVTTFSTAAQPSTGKSHATALKLTRADTDKDVNRPKLASIQPGTGKIVVIPVLTYPQNDVRSQESIAYLLVGITNFWAGVSSNGHFAIIRDGKVGWRNMIYAEGVPTDWFVANQLVLAQSTNNTDNISLADVRISATSTSGALNEAGYRVADSEGYGPLAFGIRVDGTVIDSGPAGQKCQTVVVVFQTPLFNGGATPAGLEEVYVYFIKWASNFAMTYRSWLDGDPASEGRAVVSLNGYSNQPTALVISKESGSVGLTGGNTNRLYQILSATDATGPWERAGSLYSGETNTITMSDAKMFFRAQSFP